MGGCTISRKKCYVTLEWPLSLDARLQHFKTSENLCKKLLFFIMVIIIGIIQGVGLAYEVDL